MPHVDDPRQANAPLPSSTTLPLAARVLDVIVVVSALIAVTVAVTGGFREWTPFGRLSLTSWTRPAVIALVLGLGRWMVWRREPLPRRVAARVGGWWRLEDTQTVLPVFLSTRVGVLIVGFLAVLAIGYQSPTGAPWRIYANELFNLPARFDAGWYLGIASQGYSWDPTAPSGQQNIVFFPAYPMLMRYLSLLVGRQMLWAGMLISCAAFFGALVYMFRLGREWLRADQAAAALLFLAAYPFAVFYSAAYTESLFLLAMLGTIYHFGRRELWQAALWGLLLGLTRPNGCLISIVLALMLIDRMRRESEGRWRQWPLGRYARALGAAAMPGLGMLAYSTYIFFLTGDPLQWSKQQIGWGRSYSGVDDVVADRVGFLADRGLYHYASTQTVDMLYAAALLFVLVSVWPVFRRFGLPMAVLVLAVVLPPLVSGGLLSMGRMTSIVFPSFLWLGAIVPAERRSAVAAGFAMLQAFCAAMFFTWRPLF